MKIMDKKYVKYLTNAIKNRYYQLLYSFSNCFLCDIYVTI